MSTAPSNEFNQFTLKGGYNFSPTTKLVMGASYARNTQNDQFLADPATLRWDLPVSSLNGLVVTTQFNARLTAKPIKDLNVAVGYKYNDRDNQTPVNTYDVLRRGRAASVDGVAVQRARSACPRDARQQHQHLRQSALQQEDRTSSMPTPTTLSRKGQSLKAGYEYQEIDRNCPGSWINCADATKTHENTLRVAWRRQSHRERQRQAQLRLFAAPRRLRPERVAGAGADGQRPYPPAARRKASSAFLNQTGLGGFGPIAPYVPLQPGNLGIFFPNNSSLLQTLYGSRNDIHEIPGMARFNMADRDRNKVRGTINWDATEQAVAAGNVEYNNDDYSQLGLRPAEREELGGQLSRATWTVSENFSANVFYTYEDQNAQQRGGFVQLRRRSPTRATVGGVAGNTVVSGGCFTTVLDKNANAKIDPCLNWGTDMVRQGQYGRRWASSRRD